jgi:hypothetical protein
MGREITRPELQDHFDNSGFEKIPQTTVNKILKVFPDEYRKNSGAPKKGKGSE